MSTEGRPESTRERRVGSEDSDTYGDSKPHLRPGKAWQTLSVTDEPTLHARALAAPEGPDALALWIDLAARGNPDAPERLRAYARLDSPELRESARTALEELELSHDEPMP